MKQIIVSSFLALVLVSSCAENENRFVTQDENAAKAAAVKPKLDTIVQGLQNPWGMAFLPDGRMLITERAGNIRIVEKGRLSPVKITIPSVYAVGQGGLMDIQLHPDYKSNGWIYFSYAKREGNKGSTTLARAQLQGNAFTNMQELFVVQPFISSGLHFGSRIAFDGRGYVFLSTGERGTKENAQNLQTHNGKIIRLHDDGRVPADNPFVNRAGARPEIWSYGHRNVQGMVYDRKTNLLWAHEHGPRGGDEVNLVQKGKNYGWPLTTYGINYDGTIITHDKEKPGIESPLHIWVPSIAPCGMALVTTDKYKGWKGSLLIGALAGQQVTRLQLNGKKVVKEEKLLERIGRVRAVAEAPNGDIYVLTESPGMLLKLLP